MTILLFGKTGQLGRALEKQIAGSRPVVAPDRSRVDLTNLGQVREIIAALKPYAIINAAAYTNVERAEHENADLCDLVNHQAVKVMAREAKEQGSLFITYSTDYVFDGIKPGPYREDDPPSPLNIYGHTKMLGEMAVRDSGCRHLILRTSWVYSSQPGNFVSNIVEAASMRSKIEVVNDQIGSPTHADDLARATLTMLARKAPPFKEAGATYHCTGQGSVSRFDFAKKILDYSGLKVHTRLVPIETSALVSPVDRPLNSALDCSRLERDYGIVMPDWEKSLKSLF